jgi:hypothetical protein
LAVSVFSPPLWEAGGRLRETGAWLQLAGAWLQLAGGWLQLVGGWKSDRMPGTAWPNFKVRQYAKPEHIGFGIPALGLLVGGCRLQVAGGRLQVAGGGWSGKGIAEF